MCTELTQMARVAVEGFVIASVRVAPTGVVFLQARPAERQTRAFAGPWCPQRDITP